MADRAVFYQLTHKYVNQEQDIPPGARQVIYYSLAIGHHMGVLDCFESLVEIPLDGYRRWVAAMPEGPGRRKLEGLLRWGEIEINSSHAGDLLPVLEEARSTPGSAEAQWSAVLVQSLRQMIVEPALYLMARKHT